MVDDNASDPSQEKCQQKACEFLIFHDTVSFRLCDNWWLAQTKRCVQPKFYAPKNANSDCCHTNESETLSHTQISGVCIFACSIFGCSEKRHGFPCLRKHPAYKIRLCDNYSIPHFCRNCKTFSEKSLILHRQKKRFANH